MARTKTIDRRVALITLNLGAFSVLFCQLTGPIDPVFRKNAYELPSNPNAGRTNGHGLVSFTYDDGFQDVYNVFFPIHKSVGVPGDSFYITDLVDRSGFVTWDQIREMDTTSRNRGQIKAQNHTKTHPHLVSLTDSGLVAEFGGSQEAFARQGIHTRILAYPWGEYNTSVVRIAQRYFDAARATETGDPETSIPLDPTYRFHKSAYYLSSYTVAQIDSLIDNAVANNKWVVFYIHTLAPLPVSEYRSILNYAKTHSTVVTMEEGFFYAITDVNEKDVHVPARFSLDQNYPNPFNLSTIISFSLPSESFVSLKVFDLLGKGVATLVQEQLSAGQYSRQWNGVGLPSGVYFYRLQTGSYAETKELVLLK